MVRVKMSYEEWLRRHEEIKRNARDIEGMPIFEDEEITQQISPDGSQESPFSVESI